MKNFTLILLLSYLFISCSDNKTDVYCTAIMRTSLIEVKHKDGTPYVLDSVKTFIETKEGLKVINVSKDLIEPFFQYYQEIGKYPVVGDAQDHHFGDIVRPADENERRLIGEVEFVGYKENKELFRKTSKVYASACHIFGDEKDLTAIIINETVNCTEELRTFSIDVKHKDGSPYALDRIKTFIKTKDGLKDMDVVEDYTSIGFQNCQQSGTYPVVSDTQDHHFGDFVRPTVWNEKRLIGELEFVGYKENKELFRKTVKVYTDPCHLFCDEKDLAPIELE